MTSDKPHLGGGFSCPVPLTQTPTIQLAHGGGGHQSQRLMEQVFLPRFDNPELRRLHDGALLEVGASRVAFTTDSYVVRPLFFPGGNIGDLAVNGTVNDLAMCGAVPLALSAGFILEEGLPVETLDRITESMQRAAQAAGVCIVTGDTKVVDRGKGDGVFINTAGLGLVRPGVEIRPDRACPGDKILVSGEIAAHGIAILSVREGLGFEAPLTSDTAALGGLVAQLLERVPDAVHVLRDPTRGGVASTLNEIARSASVGMVLDERSIPVAEPVRGACELLGLDPLYVANEGKCVVVVAPQAADLALEVLRAHPLGTRAASIGEVTQTTPGVVTMRSRIGAERVVDMLSGEQLPRIC
ncbi:MAG: hydrogenase expression/formation protein HypE [Polyangiaceae bacterium]|nr:hydrogenase expression/formation protein HypE [Polyangiaceae bacterium]